MSRSAGPGSPLSFMCGRCRAIRSRWLNPALLSEGGKSVHLTGLTRPRRDRPGRIRGPRHTDTEREYRCQECGYRGWSSHVDLGRMDKGTPF